MTSPKGSNLGRLYGLTKVHKDNLPSRPVLSAIGTFSYGLDNPPIPLPPTVNTDTVIIRIPYFGLTSKVYGKRLTLAIKYHYPPKLTRIVDDVKDRIGSAVTIKDNIPTQSKSYVVYEANCPKCSDTYIEKTYRQH
ncbi:unnamed protein product [Rotaria magnacalcarata]|uniref:Uncharacterized protein n=1 Tax=Rotaria magnacalcarata TaxID=392030 RepID=A0A816WUD8_9BILA|nr:unnamed protein product [Rotaria magnacalcarata]CAF2138307.1 unnamed protein product [Rotaria magnacalcarata]